MPTRIAAIAVTRGGAVIARRIAAAVPAQVWLARSVAEPAERVAVFDPPLRDHVGRLWAECDGLIFVMAAGAVVRLIAPHLTDKHRDPAVVVVDETARHAVSLLSGHAGGADELCERVAAALGAAAVVTGASAALGAPAFDVISGRNGWVIENPAALTAVASAVVNGRLIAVHQDCGDAEWQRDLGPARITLAAVDEWAKASPAVGVVISDSTTLRPPESIPVLILRPKVLRLGIGCERGTSATVIAHAARTALADADLSPLSVAEIATIDVKHDEAGLLAFAAELGVPLRLFTAAELAGAAGAPNPSDAVRDAVGTPGVAEPAALLAASARTLMVSKRVFRLAGEPGAATIAVARDADGRRRGRVTLVGLGPGADEHRTPAAVAALSQADVVIGFDAYIAAARSAIPACAEVISLPIGAEVERARRAVELAVAGRRVVVVSGGDVGVFGMAGPVYEQWSALPPAHRPDIETLPAITAAQAAAALLGAPLMHDFACISLSDHLTPGAVIERRVAAAAAADFVVALYNPAARARTEPLAAALRLFRDHRPGGTPVGIVRDAFRPGGTVRVSTLADFPADAIDMHTVVVVGNSQTRVVAGRMITPRGYADRAPVGGERDA